MKASQRIGLSIGLLGLGGLALFVILLIHNGAGKITQSVADAGWGLLLVLACHFITLFCDSLSWRALIPRDVRPSMRRLLVIHWIGDSVSSMLPVAQVGGEVVRVRLLHQHDKVPLPAATSSVLVGMTLSVATQIIFTIAGLALMTLMTGHNNFAWPILLVSMLGIACVAGFYAVQRVGIFHIALKIISHIAGNQAWESVIQKGAKLDEDVRTLYACKPMILESTFWTCCTWIAGTIEVWVALRVLGVNASYPEAFVLESMAQGIRSAAFLIPGALGVQEGGYIVVGRLFNITGEIALALALIRRTRELAFGIPGLLAWQWAEGTRLWARHKSTALPEPALDKAP